MTTGPELTMLWEPTDSREALKERFGFADEHHAASWIEETLEKAWSFRATRCDRLVISASKLLAWITVDGTDMIAKCAVDPAKFRRLADVDAVTAWLHSEGIPVAAPIAATDGRLRGERDGFSLGLYPVVDGRLLDVDNESDVDAAGRMLATMHNELQAYPHSFRGDDTDHGGQLVHGDYRSANILIDDHGVAAILDFDDATYRSRAWELARSSILLGTQYHDWRPTNPSTRHAFVAAYADVAPLTPADRRELEIISAAVLQHFNWT